jgi:hypothetical protein
MKTAPGMDWSGLAVPATQLEVFHEPAGEGRELDAEVGEDLLELRDDERS